MSRMKKLLFIAPVSALFAVGFIATTLAAPPQGKSEICHVANDKYVKITVSNSAVPAHMAHGDIQPDDYGECP